jgi:hypothetical protein
LPYSGLAYNYINAEDWFIPPLEAAPKAKAAAQKALAIDATTSEAHLVLGIIAHWYEWDWVNSEREFKRAIELNPNDPLAISSIRGCWRRLDATKKRFMPLGEARRSIRFRR